MSDNGESKSPLSLHETRMSEYEANILPPHSMPGLIDEYEEYFTADAAKLKSSTLEKCAIISTRLSQYSLFIQRCINRDKSRVSFLKDKLDGEIVEHMGKHAGQGLSWDLQRRAAINSAGQSAFSYHKQIQQIEQRMERLEHIALSIKNLSDSFKNLQYAKLKDR